MREYGLEDRVALVTGAGRGIGFAIAKEFARVGANAAIADIRQDLAEKAAQSLQREGMQSLPVAVDVSSRASIERMVGAVVEHFGRIDILVNNAGIHPFTRFEEINETEWDTVLAVNLKGMFLCSQAVFPLMKEQGGGCLLNLASMAGRTGGKAASVHYTASKAGVMGITRSMAMHLGPYGIRVNALAPGIIQTEMTATWSDETMAGFLQQIPLGRLGNPEDVARAAVFLCSGAAGYLTGVVLDVTGGLVMS